MGILRKDIEASVATSANENGGNSERKGLFGYTKEQMKKFWNSQDRRTAVFREMVQGKKREVAGTTYETFARALTDEYLSLDKVVKKDKAADLPEWQKKLVDVVKHEFRKHHTNKDYSLEGKTGEEIYNAYYSVFDKLLRSEDPDEARQWLTTAMIATERQIVAIQLSTGAKNRVTHEAEHIDHVEEPEAMAATISSETGVPIDQVRGDISRTRKIIKSLRTGKAATISGVLGVFFVGGPMGGSIGMAAPAAVSKFVEWVYKRDPGRRIKWEDDTKTLEMLRQFQDESRKRVHSDVEVGFAHDATFRLDREYHAGSLPWIELDTAQKEFLKGQKVLGTVHEGDKMDVRAQKEVGTLLKRLTHARQDAYYVEFDEQLRTEQHLNLLTPIDQDKSSSMDSGLGGVNPQIEGMTTMTVGLDATISLEQQLEEALGAIQKRVTQERLDDVATGDMVDNVGEQVKTLTSAVEDKKLSEEEQKKRDDLVEEKKKQEAQKIDLEKYESLTKEIADVEEAIVRKEEEAKPIAEAEEALKTVEGEIKSKKREKGELERKKGKKEGEIARLEERKRAVEDEIRELTEKKGAREAQNKADNAHLTQIKSNIGQLEAWLGANSAIESNQAIVASRMQELQALQQQRDQLEANIAGFTSANQHFDALIQSKKDEINNAANGLVRLINDAEDEINNAANGLVKLIDDAEDEIIEKTKEKERQQEIVDAGKEKLEEIEALENKKADLAAQQAAALAAIRRKDQTITDAPQIAARLRTIDKDIKRIESDIEVIDIDLEIDRMGDQHQLEVLTAFKEEFLTPDKWGGIKKRAREPLTAQAEAAALERTDAFTRLGMGVGNRPFVMPAYLRTMSILGGEDALKRDTAGEELYKKLSSVVTPEIFFEVFTADKTRADALAQTIGESSLPANMSVYDERLIGSADAKRLMVRMVDRHFTMDLLADLVNRANNRDRTQVGSLGRLDQVTLDRMREVAQREKNIPKDAIEKRKEVLRERAQEERFKYEWFSVVRKAGAASKAIDFIINTLNLNQDQAAIVLDTVRTLSIKHNIQLDVSPTTYTGTQLSEAQAAFTAAGITLSDAQILDAINAIRPLQIISTDLSAYEARINFENAIKNVKLDKTKQQEQIALSLRTALYGRMPSLPLSDATAYDEQFQGKALKDIINEELTKQLGKSIQLDTTQLADLVSAYHAIKPIYLASSEAISQVTHQFLEYGGNIKDSVLISGLMTEVDSTTDMALQKAMYDIASDVQPTIGELIDHISDPALQAFIGAKQKQIEDLIVNAYRTNGGDLMHTFANISVRDVQRYMPMVLEKMRTKGLGSQLSTIYIKEEADANQKLYSAEVSSAMLTRKIERFGKKYWGERGRALALKIEAELGGKTYRDEAIRIARVIEVDRAKHTKKKEKSESS